MGKSKKKDSAKAAAAAASAPKCVCEHPYAHPCACGHRPVRPSKGHKWYPEEQVWAGKGHKQKGASGQTALVAKEATVTKKGQTKVDQWQRLPSQLLADVCQRQKRPAPKFKNIEKQGGSSVVCYKYRVIVCDQKGDPDKNLFFVPAKAVANEEQAKEEGALVALLSLTPTLPHERKLPEPYRTTWLNAIQSIKETAAKAAATSRSKQTKSAPATALTSTATPSNAGPSSSNNSKKPPASNNGSAGAQGNGNGNNSNSGKGGAAVASSSLLLGSGNGAFMSREDKRKQQEEKRRLRNAKIRKHENIRMANQNHPVFMSSAIRKMIERLLRGESPAGSTNGLHDEDDDEEEENPAGENEATASVVHRLFSEGFTKSQARAAYKELSETNQVFQESDNEDVWDQHYEECLQWLLVHLDEDQLPEGFDPRGGTLAVEVPTAASVAAAGDNESDTTSLAFAASYGITVKEAKLIAALAAKENLSTLDAFWQTIQTAAGVSAGEEALSNDDAQDDTDEARDELEALEAIYGADCTVTREEPGLCSVKVALEDGSMSLQVVVQVGAYPNVRPKSVLVSGKWPSKIGSSFHVELIKFLDELPLGEPMIFTIHAQVQDLLLSEALSELSLLPYLGVVEKSVPMQKDSGTKESSNEEKQSRSYNSDAREPLRQRRPRQTKRTFWSTHPRDTPPATAFPKVSQSMERTRKSLPAAKSRKEFLAAMELAEKGGRVLLVTGETGSGKSTQLPAYLLENDPKGAKIVVAQPRRLAATGVATRVAEERGEPQAGVDSVGYVVRGDSAICNNSRLIFCTTGVLLRQLQNDGALDCVTHVCIDEVHERSLDSDVLLGLLKQSMSANPHLRVILMSATLDTTRFQQYWGPTTPHVHLPGRTFPVTDFLLEDVLKFTGYIPPKKKKGKKYYGGGGGGQGPRKKTAWNDSEMSEEENDDDDGGATTPASTTKGPVAQHGIPIDDLVKRVDETSPDPDLICRLVKHLIVNKDKNDDGSILVFLAGAPEINNVMDTIKRGTRDLPVVLLALHGGLQPKEQNRAFQRASKGFTKVILSTNVAETSVTIPDCTIVIDTGREKQSSYDPTNRMPLLLEQFASKASMKQRRGRAGRVQAGTCYKLISKATFETLKDHSEPEIRRVALDQTLLQLLFLGVERGSGTFMRTLLDAPNKESIEAASSNLRILGAVEPGENEGDLFLTPLGAHLAGIPAPPIVGKMLVMGSLLGCRAAGLAMAAGISLGRSPFLRIDSPRNRGGRSADEEASMEEVKHKRIIEERTAYAKEVGNSDHALLASIFMKWQATGSGSGLRKRFCDSLGLSFTGLRDMAQLVNQLDSALGNAGFMASRESDRNTSSWRIIHACAVSSMAPGQLVKVRRPAIKYTETAEGAQEKDGEARELKFFIRTAGASGEHSWAQEERVFIHPSSTLFANGNYSCPFLVYNSMVRTSKPFLRDVTECSAYALLLFGGELEIKASKGVIVVGGWAELSANARIGSLVGGLRRKVDALLTEKVKNPNYQDPEIMDLIVRLIRTDGLGT